MTFPGRCALSLPLFLAVVSGCSISSSPARVSGTVTYKGEMVPAGTVIFHLPEGGIFSYPLQEGKFSGPDLPIGEMVVTVDTEYLNTAGRPVEKYGKDKGGDGQVDYLAKMREMGKVPTAPAEPGKYVKIPPKYTDPATSPLKVNLTKGMNELPLVLQDD